MLLSVSLGCAESFGPTVVCSGLEESVSIGCSVVVVEDAEVPG